MRAEQSIARDHRNCMVWLYIMLPLIMASPTCDGLIFFTFGSFSWRHLVIMLKFFIKSSEPETANIQNICSLSWKCINSKTITYEPIQQTAIP